MKNIYIILKKSRKTLSIMKIQYLACLFVMKNRGTVIWNPFQRKTALFAKQLKILRTASGHY